MSEKTYSVSELSEELNLPRTTINDWLNRYGAFLEFELKGKRKSYTAKSMAVLKRVSELRSSGLPTLEVESEMEKEYGIHGELTADSAPENRKEEKETAAADLPSVPSLPQAMTVPQADFEALFNKINQENAMRNQALRRTFRFMLVLLILLGAMAIYGAFWLLKYLEAEKNHNQLNAEKAAERQQEINRNLLSSTLKIGEIDRKNQENSGLLVSELMKNRELLQKQLQEQKAELDRQLTLMKSDADGRYELQIAKLRESFAAGRRDMLKALEENAAQITSLEKQLSNQLEENGKLRKLLEERTRIMTEESLKNHPKNSETSPSAKGAE